MAYVALALAFAAPDGGTCPSGREVSADTAGQCCWPRQVWSATRQHCVGLPACPSGLVAYGETCGPACAPGMTVTPDTLDHCCWPRQAWSASRMRCVGVPDCPAGWHVDGETCLVGPPAEARDGGMAAELAGDAGSPDGGAMLASAVEVSAPSAQGADAGVRPAVSPLAATPAAATTRRRVHPPNFLVFTGAGVFLLAWVPAVATPATLGNYSPDVSDVVGIPLAGPIMARDRLSDRALTQQAWGALTIIDAVLQWAGAGAMVAGGILWAVGREEPPQGGPVVQWWLAPQGGGVTVRW